MWLLDEYGVYGAVRGWEGRGLAWVRVWGDIRSAIRRLFGVVVVVTLVVEVSTLLLKFPRLDEPNMSVRENTRMFKQRSRGTPALEYVFRLSVADVMGRFNRRLDAWFQGEEDRTEAVKPTSEKEIVTVFSLAMWDRTRYPTKREGVRSKERRIRADTWIFSKQRLWGMVLSVWLVLFLGLIHLK